MHENNGLKRELKAKKKPTFHEMQCTLQSKAHNTCPQIPGQIYFSCIKLKREFLSSESPEKLQKLEADNQNQQLMLLN